MTAFWFGVSELRNEKRAREELDPMDPSSYSDVPRLVA